MGWLQGCTYIELSSVPDRIQFFALAKTEQIPHNLRYLEGCFDTFRDSPEIVWALYNIVQPRDHLSAVKDRPEIVSALSEAARRLFQRCPKQPATQPGDCLSAVRDRPEIVPASYFYYYKETFLLRTTRRLFLCGKRHRVEIFAAGTALRHFYLRISWRKSV